MTDSKPYVYIIYGIEDSERRAVVFDLIEGGVTTNTQVLYFRPEDANSSSYDEQIEALANVSVVPWKLNGAKVVHGSISAAPEKIIFLAPADSDPSDVAEAIKNWSEHNNCQIARIITVAHCKFIEAKPEALPWFDACIHFSDVVLLSRRDGVNNKWVKTFEERYTKNYFTCRFLLVKKGRVSNPPEVLDPEARRYSLYFDELIPIEEDEFEDQRPEDQAPDKYIERNESGNRAHPIPHISKFIGQQS